MQNTSLLKVNDKVRLKSNSKISGLVIDIISEREVRIQTAYAVIHENPNEWERLRPSISYAEMENKDAEWLMQARQNVKEHERNIAKAIDERNFATADTLRSYCDNLYNAIKELGVKYECNFL